jgi:hypothetical protein
VALPSYDNSHQYTGNTNTSPISPQELIAQLKPGVEYRVQSGYVANFDYVIPILQNLNSPDQVLKGKAERTLAGIMLSQNFNANNPDFIAQLHERGLSPKTYSYDKLPNMAGIGGFYINR